MHSSSLQLNVMSKEPDAYKGENKQAVNNRFVKRSNKRKRKPGTYVESRPKKPGTYKREKRNVNNRFVENTNKNKKFRNTYLRNVKNRPKNRCLQKKITKR